MPATPPARIPGEPDRLKQQVERFLASLRHAVLVENGVEACDLSTSEWRLSIEFGKLIFEAWNQEGSLVRRLESVAYEDSSRLGIIARKSALREAGNLEFREAGSRAPVAGRPEEPGKPARGLRASTAAERAFRRTSSRQALVAELAARFPGWRLERVSQRSDREHSFSGWYTRGWARQASRDRIAWAFLGLAQNEAEAAADSALAFGLIWLDWLRQRFSCTAFVRLKLFLPPTAAEVNAHRAVYLNPGAGIEIYPWNSGEPGGLASAPLDLADFGNIETSLPLRRERESLLALTAERIDAVLDRVLGGQRGEIDRVPDPSRHWVSLRVRGLEVARVEAGAEPRFSYGIEPSHRRLEAEGEEEFGDFLRQVLRIRQASSDDPRHELYRLQAERWLESLLVRDLTRLDPALSPDDVYPQVPAFTGTSSSRFDRGVIDILGVARDQRGYSRLAVIELKVEEDINLPLQGLDYWLRVKWLHERGQFKARGYFSELAPEPPILYLVSPAFRFHSSTGAILRYFDPAMEVIQVGINDQWREGVRVLYRRKLGNPKGPAPANSPESR